MVKTKKELFVTEYTYLLYIPFFECSLIVIGKEILIALCNPGIEIGVFSTLGDKKIVRVQYREYQNCSYWLTKRF